MGVTQPSELAFADVMVTSWDCPTLISLTHGTLDYIMILIHGL